MRFAVVGAGVIGEVHARLVSEVAELAVVVDLDGAKASRIAEQYGGDVLTDLAAACARDDVDAVSICLPSGYHADAAITALQAGKHVVIEKPLDVTLAAADRIMAAERASGRTVAVISQRRFQAAPAFVHEAIEAGRLGRITTGSAESAFWRPQEYYDSGGWRGTVALDGGGALMNQGIHLVDLLLWMLGEPVEVQAHTGLLAHERIEVEDTAAATVRFAGGAIGTILATTAAYPGRPVRLSVYGDQGSAVIEDEELVHFATVDNHAPELSGAQSVADAHRAQYLDFIQAVTTGRPPLIGTHDARRALAVVLGVYESARTSRPVRL